MPAQRRPTEPRHCAWRSRDLPFAHWVISLETGKALGADEGAVKTIPVKIEEGRISLGLGEMLLAAE